MVEPLKTYEFAGGNQIATSKDAMLYLPQFQLFERTVTTKAFDITEYTSQGMPSYIAIYCRDPRREAALNYQSRQPIIRP